MPPLAPNHPRVRFEIIAWQRAIPPGPAILEKPLRQRPVDGAGMIIIDPGSVARREVRTVEIKIVQRQPRCLLSKDLLQAIGEPAFPGSAAANNGHQSW